MIEWKLNSKSITLLICSLHKLAEVEMRSSKMRRERKSTITKTMRMRRMSKKKRRKKKMKRKRRSVITSHKQPTTIKSSINEVFNNYQNSL